MALCAPAMAVERPSVDGWPGFAVGRLNVRGAGFCTATLIATDRALTAAHCLRDGNRGWYPPGRLVLVFAPYRSSRKGYAGVIRISPAPGLQFADDDRPSDPARDWAVLELDDQGRRDSSVTPVALATPTDRAALVEGGQVSLLAYTPSRPFVATLAEACKVVAKRVKPDIILHDCAGSAAVAGAPVFMDTARGSVLVGIQVGTGVLDGLPVGVAAVLERQIEPEAIRAGDVQPP